MVQYNPTKPGPLDINIQGFDSIFFIWSGNRNCFIFNTYNCYSKHKQ